MPAEALFANNAQSTLGSPVASTDTTITLATGGGATFPSIVTAGNYFNVTLTDFSSQTIREIVQVTAKAGDIFTVVRGTQNTVPANWAVGDIVFQLCTAGDLGNFVQPAQLQLQAGNYAQDTGSVNALAIALSPAPDSYAAIIGAPIRVRVAHTTTGAATLNVNDLGGISIVYGPGSALDANAMYNGSIYELSYNGGNFLLASGQDGPVALLKSELASEIANREAAITAEATARGDEDTILQNDINTRALLAAFAFGGGTSGSLSISEASVGAPRPIIQWGTGNTVTGNLDTVTFPEAFPNACLRVVACEGEVGGWTIGGVCVPTVYGISLVDRFTFQISAAQLAGGTNTYKSGVTYSYFAIGY